MRTPGGWAMSHMLYDKLPSAPPSGSPLESLFMLVYLERANSALLAHRALIQAVLPLSKNEQDPAIKAYEAYCDHLFPFIERASNKNVEDEETKKRLEEFTKHPSKIDLRPIYKARMQDAMQRSQKRFKVVPRIPGRQQHPTAKT